MDILEAWNKENVCMILRIDFYDDIFFFLSWAHEDMDVQFKEMSINSGGKMLNEEK